MHAQVRSIHFPDLTIDESFDPANTVQLAEIEVGPSSGEGADIYQITVCTVTALAEMLEKQRFLTGRHWLFVREFGTTEVSAIIRRVIGDVEGHNWHHLAEQIGRIGHWEYEDYAGS